MLRRAITVIVPVLSFAIIGPVAQAAATKHAIKLTIRDSTITSQGDRPGNKQTTAGLVSGNPFGHGVESISDKVASATSTTFKFKGTITIYTTHGNINATINFTVTPASSGGATGTGGGNITGGSGRYIAAHGHYTFTGNEAANSSVFVSHVIGTVTY